MPHIVQTVVVAGNWVAHRTHGSPYSTGGSDRRNRGFLSIQKGFPDQTG
jgi:hypothetical protein